MNEKSNGKAEKHHVIMYLSGGLKILGKVVKTDVTAGKEVELTNVWQISQMMAPTQDGAAISQLTMLMPLPGARGKTKCLKVVPEVWMFADDAGCLEHIKELLEDVEHAERVDSAKKHGIALPGQPGRGAPAAMPGMNMIGQIKVPPHR